MAEQLRKYADACGDGGQLVKLAGELGISVSLATALAHVAWSFQHYPEDTAAQFDKFIDLVKKIANE